MKLSPELRFLIVDDNHEMRGHVVSTLKKNNFKNILEASSVSEAEKLLEQAFNSAELVDVVLCDHHMPDNTGLDFINYVKMSIKFKNVIFITITSDSSRAVVLPYIGAGADGFVVKPVSEKELLTKISQLIKEIET